jgi:uncharacterized protein (DUF1800 family)
MHQPGPQTVIGTNYPGAGVEQGRAVLAVLARHPATAKHVASKLARHFVADEPPPALVERLAKRFLATQGDLKEMAKALVAAPEAWEAPRTKLKRPGEWVIAALRAVGAAPLEIGPVMQAYNLLGEPLWRPSAPKGFVDESAPWLDGLAQRLDIANQFARRFGAEADPRDSKKRLHRSPRPKRGKPSRAPRAARRHSRFCSWRPSSSADDAPAIEQVSR